MTVVIVLIVLGILLFVIEFLLVPGITIAGIGGLVLTVFGVYKAFNDFGSSIGVWVLIGTLMISVFVIAMSLRARTWNRLMLKTKIKGTVDTALSDEEIKVGPDWLPWERYLSMISFGKPNQLKDILTSIAI